MNWNIPIGKKRTIQRITSFLPADLQQFARQRLYGNWRDFAGARRPLPPDQTFIDNLTHPSRCLTEPIKTFLRVPLSTVCGTPPEEAFGQGALPSTPQPLPGAPVREDMHANRVLDAIGHGGTDRHDDAFSIAHVLSMHFTLQNKYIIIKAKINLCIR
jgi:hypothetical protein